MKIINKRILSGFLAAALLLVSLCAPWSVSEVYAASVIDDIEKLGDWNHYNGIFFGNMTSYQADTEGAIAVGGERVLWGLKSGFDAGASYGYNNTVHMGQYTNPRGYPTVLLNADEIQVGALGASAGHYNVFGGPIVMNEALLALHDTGTPYKLGTSGGAYFATADKAMISEWFDYQYRMITGAMRQYLDANEVEISYADFSSGSYFKNRNATDFLNETLYYNGSVDRTVLFVTVRTSSTVNGIKMPLDATWPEQYELVVFNFPDLVNVTMNGDAQPLSNSRITSPHWPDGYNTSGNDQRDAICANVIYSFPVARSMTITSLQLFGSIFAPDADVSLNGGQINGQLVANDYVTQGGGELHARRFNRRAYELVDEPEEEDGLASFTLSKYLHYRVNSSVLLEGAEYHLYVYDEAKGIYNRYGGNITYRTDQDGSFTVEDLPYGSYWLREVTAPAGFAIDRSIGDVYFELSAEHTREALELTAYNEPMYLKLSFLKVDADQPDRTLEGASFRLVRLPDEYDFSTTEGVSFYAESGPDGSLSFAGLPMGSYVLKELSPPEGYEHREDLYFDIVYVAGELVAVVRGGYTPLPTNAEGQIVVENEGGNDDGALNLFKHSTGADQVAKGLEGARFHLYQEISGGVWQRYERNGEPVVLETDVTGYARIEGLPHGNWRVVELAAPDGYLPDNPHSGGGAMPDYAGETKVGPASEGAALLPLSNEPLTATIELRKLGDLDGGETALGGVRFELWSVDTETDEETRLFRQTTPADGILHFGDLGAGRYALRETATATGYRLIEGDILIEVDFADDGTPLVEVDPGLNGDLVDFDGKALVLTVRNRAATGSLTVYKMDGDRFQNGTDWDEGRSYTVTYLEGAEFQLHRKADGFSGNWEPFGQPFASSFTGYSEDEWGNPVAGGRIDGLPYGDYRIVETRAPDGYRIASEDGVVGSFTITEAMAQQEAAVELDVSNLRDTPRGEITVRKVDRADSSKGLPDVEFKLWRIDDSIFPLTGREHIDDVMPYLARYGQSKYDLGHPLLTDEDGELALSLEPGVYVLFEYEPADGYLYTLERGQTLERATDPSFYHYTYLFQVVAMPDPDDGVRIRWVDRYKILTGEVIFNVDANDLPNASWSAAAFADESEYRSFVITNRQEDALRADVELRKLDEENRELAGATFALERADLKDEEDDTPYADGDFSSVRSYESGVDGKLVMTGLREGMYRLTETDAPDGYNLLGKPVEFSLRVNGYSKALDLYSGEGVLLGAGYTEPVIGSGDKTPGALGLTTYFPLGSVQNLPADTPVGALTLIKRDAEDETLTLPGAVFTLWNRVDGAWSPLRTGLTTGPDGTLTIAELPAGEYRLTETAPPNGYEDEALELFFTMVADGGEVIPDPKQGAWDTDGRLVAENTAEEAPDDPTGSLTLVKRDAEDETLALSGAVFTLWNRADGAWSALRTGLTTGPDGTLTIAELPAGEYRLTETAPPDGYEDEALELFFAMVADGNEVVSDPKQGAWDTDGRLVAENTAEEAPDDPTGSLTLRKVDAEDEKLALPGAVFSLHREEHGAWTLLQAGLTTDSDGVLVLSDLSPGHYRLTETAAPDGYLSEGLELFFNMTAHGDEVLPDRSIGSWDNADGALLGHNRADPTVPGELDGELVLRKVDAEKGGGLDGAVFDLDVLEDGVWNELRSGLTTGEGGLLVIDGLQPGEYRLTETAPPEGYLDDRLTLFFEMVLTDSGRVAAVSDGNGWQDGILIAPNTAEPKPGDLLGELLVEKVDADNGRPLSGAVFDLYRAGEDTPWRRGLTTGEDGTLTVLALPAGHYTLRETHAPEGYRPGDAAIAFEMVEQNGQVAPAWQTADDAVYRLYRWEAAEPDEDQVSENEQDLAADPTGPEGGEPDTDGEGEPDDDLDGEKTGESPDPGEGGDSGDGGSDDSSGEESPAAADAGDGAGDAQTRSISEPDVPLTTEAGPPAGEWVAMGFAEYRVDADAVIRLRDLPAGSYKLVPDDGTLAERFFELTEEVELYELMLSGEGGEPLPLRIENRRRTGGGGGSGGGNGGQSGGGESSGPREPAKSGGTVVIDVSNAGGSPTNNASTGVSSSAALLATGLGLAGAGGAFAGRKSLRWWLRGLRLRLHRK